VLQRRGLFGQFFFQGDIVGRGADIGVDFYPDILPDGNGLKSLVPFVGGYHQGAVGQTLFQDFWFNLLGPARLLHLSGNFTGHRCLSLGHDALLHKKFYPNLPENETVALGRDRQTRSYSSAIQGRKADPAYLKLYPFPSSFSPSGSPPINYESPVHGAHLT